MLLVDPPAPLQKSEVRLRMPNCSGVIILCSAADDDGDDRHIHDTNGGCFR